MKSRFRLGPATMLTMAATIVIAYFNWPNYQKQAREKQAMQELRDQIAQRKTHPFKPAHTLDSLWARRMELKLTPGQAAALQKLCAEEKRLNVPLQHDSERAADEFQRWMMDKQKHGGVTVAEIQKNSAPVSETSSVVAEARRRYFENALSLLSAEQRNQVERWFQ